MAIRVSSELFTLGQWLAKSPVISSLLQLHTEKSRMSGVVAWQDAAGNSAIPVIVNGQTEVAEVTVGTTRVCVRHSDNSIDCWGEPPIGRITF